MGRLNDKENSESSEESDDNLMLRKCYDSKVARYALIFLNILQYFFIAGHAAFFYYYVQLMFETEGSIILEDMGISVHVSTTIYSQLSMLVFLVVFTHFAHASWTYMEKQVYSQYLMAALLMIIVQ